jgi:hypothetical protein
MPANEKLPKRPLTIYAYFNNHYGFSPASARAFSELLDRTIGKRTSNSARPASAPTEQINLF